VAKSSEGQVIITDIRSYEVENGMTNFLFEQVAMFSHDIWIPDERDNKFKILSQFLDY